MIWSDANARTDRQLLDGARFSIDFYQREYAWQERQIRELIDDLTGKFLDSFEPAHARHEIEGSGHYFLIPAGCVTYRSLPPQPEVAKSSEPSRSPAVVELKFAEMSLLYAHQSKGMQQKAQSLWPEKILIAGRN